MREAGIARAESTGVYIGVATASAYVYIRVYVSRPGLQATYTPIHTVFPKCRHVVARWLGFSARLRATS